MPHGYRHVSSHTECLLPVLQCKGTQCGIMQPICTVHALDFAGITCLDLHVFLLCSDDIEQLAKRKHVYLVTPEEGKSFVAKVVATPYPCQLHEELSDLGLAPKLVAPVEECPGWVQVIRMEYLDPADGWTRLERFNGNWDALHEVALEALESLQSCLDGKAVHGDLNPGNLLVRYAVNTGRVAWTTKQCTVT